MTRDQVESFYWRAGLRILSLDFTRAVYHHLGVGVECHETVRGIARDALTGRLAVSANYGAGELNSGFYSQQVIPFLGAVDRALGRSARDNVQYWAQYVACAEPSNPWTLYEGLFSTWASVLRRTGKDEIGFGTDPLMLANKFRAATDLSDIKEVLGLERKKPITEWDAICFERLEVYDHPQGDYFPYVAEIDLAVAMKRFHDFWRWLVAAIGPSDLRAIESAVRRSTSQEDDSLCPPDRLPFPPPHNTKTTALMRRQE